MHGIETGSQDAVFAVAVHNYTHDKLAALFEAHRITSPGGIALVTINPFTPIKLSAGNRELNLRLGDVIDYMKRQGHDIEYASNLSYSPFHTIQLSKNKLRLGLGARFIGALPWESAGGLKEEKWIPEKENLEMAAHYAVNRKTLDALRTFMAGRPPKRLENPPEEMGMMFSGTFSPNGNITGTFGVKKNR